jgi:hypothetical protein
MGGAHRTFEANSIAVADSNGMTPVGISSILLFGATPRHRVCY